MAQTSGRPPFPPPPPAGGTAAAGRTDTLAARVLTALAALAADPAPGVAAAADAALRAAGVDVEPVPGAVAAPPRPPPPTPGIDGSGGARGGYGSAGASGSGVAGTSGGSRWKPLAWRAAAAAAVAAADRAAAAGSSVPRAGSAAGSAPGSPVGSPPSRVPPTAWPPFVLRASSDVPGEGSGGGAGRSPSDDLATGGTQTPPPPPLPPLPPSAAYAAARSKFCAPMLARSGAGWAGVPPPAGRPRDPALTAARERERAAARAQCGRAYAAGARVVDTAIVSVETGVPATEALALHPFRAALAAAGADGVLRVYASPAVGGEGGAPGVAAPACTNAFALDGPSAPPAADAAPLPAAAAAARAARPRGAPALFLLNETHASVLVAGGADGAARVWRDWSFRGAQRLASAWQAAPLLPEGGGGAPTTTTYLPACYALDAARGGLYAGGAGGGATVALWSLSAERRAATLTATLPGAPAAAVAQLAVAAAPGPPLVAAGLGDGAVVLLDARAPRSAVCSVRARATPAPLAGLVAGPGGRPHQLVTACPTGELAFIDWRRAGDGAPPAVGVTATVAAHSTGGLSALAAHPHAPLLATGTTSQVVKLWSASGDPLGTVRAHGPLLSAHPGAVAALAFHPYRGLLASAGRDPFIAIFPVAPVGR